MKWVTRKRVHVNRAATAWLIRRFVDSEAQILFVEAAEVAETQRREGAQGFDAPGAAYVFGAAMGPARSAAPGASPDPAPALDTARIEELTGAKGTLDEKEGVFKVSVPRSDLSVTAAGVHVTPPLGLTSWAAFEPA